MKHTRAEAEKAVRAAGKLFLSAVDERQIIEKGFANFVTEVDYRVQDFLIRELDRIIPGCNIVTEEKADNLYAFHKPTWILDPVDGTTNLMFGYNHSCISLALLEGGNPVMGIVYNPVSGELFSATAGQGAFLNEIPIAVSRRDALEKSLIGFGTTPYDKGSAERTFSIVLQTYRRCLDVRRTGSAALDLAYVACAMLDGFFELRLQPWDYAAGMVLIAEAGGRVTDWKGEQPSLAKPSGIVATNGLIQDDLLEMVNLQKQGTHSALE